MEFSTYDTEVLLSAIIQTTVIELDSGTQQTITQKTHFLQSKVIQKSCEVPKPGSMSLIGGDFNIKIV